MKVECEIDHTDVENDRGREVPGVVATCSRCGHTTQCLGQSAASVKRALVMLREQCPEKEENFYVADDGSDER